jgi:hypothetical protein
VKLFKGVKSVKTLKQLLFSTLIKNKSFTNKKSETFTFKTKNLVDKEFLKKYKKVEVELRNGESLRRASTLGGCSHGIAQKMKRLMTIEA